MTDDNKAIFSLIWVGFILGAFLGIIVHSKISERACRVWSGLLEGSSKNRTNYVYVEASRKG